MKRLSLSGLALCIAAALNPIPSAADAPLEADDRFQRAREATDAGRTDEALALYRELAAERPERPEPHNNLAALLAQRGDIEGARRELLSALTGHPSYATAFKNLQAIHTHLAGIAYRKALNGDGDAGGEPLELAAIATLPMEKPRLVVAAAAEPIAEPVTEPLPAEPVVDTGAAIQAVEAAARGWAEAWSAQEVDRYLGHYADDYRPDEMGRVAWIEQRRQRLTKPRFIRVTLHNLMVRLTAESRAEALFDQEYRADTYRDRVQKRLSLENRDGAWVIVREEITAE